MSLSGTPLNAQSIPERGLDRDAALTLIAAAGDLALVVDRDGVIRDVSTADGSECAADDLTQWTGQPWAETVLPESRARVEMLLRDVAAAGTARRRQVTHVMPGGLDMPVSYTVVRLNDEQGNIVAVGRDLRTVATLQQRLVETQQALERDYWRMRHVETRYRLLFQLSSEAILVVDAANRRVVDVNDAATRLFNRASEKIIGRTFPFALDADSDSAIEHAMANARTAGRSENVSVKLEESRELLTVSISGFRQDSASLFLIRLSAPGAAPASSGANLGALLAAAPDGFVVTDGEGRVVSANQAFLDQVQLAGERQTHGRLISDWVGRPGADLSVFLSTLRKNGAVRNMSTSVRGEQGNSSELEVSAAAASGSEPDRIGFVLRDVGRRVAGGPRVSRDLSAAVEQLTSLVGRVAIRDLLRDTSDLVERHFIEAALELTGDNRTAAAEVLGLSRQSLYVKLRRHQLASLSETNDLQAG